MYGSVASPTMPRGFMAQQFLRSLQSSVDDRTAVDERDALRVFTQQQPTINSVCRQELLGLLAKLYVCEPNNGYGARHTRYLPVATVPRVDSKWLPTEVEYWQTLDASSAEFSSLESLAAEALLALMPTEIAEDERRSWADSLIRSVG